MFLTLSPWCCNQSGSPVFFANVTGTSERFTVQQAAGQMDPVQSKGYFVLDALRFAEVKRCLHSLDQKTLSQTHPETWARRHWAVVSVSDVDSHWPQLCGASCFWFEVIRFVILSTFSICDAMDQMADEMTLRADVRDKGRASAAEEGSCRVRGGK